MKKPAPSKDSEVARWVDEKAFRERELAVEERRLEHEIEMASKDESNDQVIKWSSPIVIAVFAAAVAAFGNALVSLVEGYQDRQLETSKAEQARILEMIKTGDPDTAATNLEFILDAGLIKDQEIVTSLRSFLQNREPGTGPVLTSTGPIARGIVGFDDAVKVSALSLAHPVRSLARSVGRLDIRSEQGIHFCTAFMVESKKIATAGHCLSDIEAANFLLFPESTMSGEVVSFEVDTGSVTLDDLDGAGQIAFLELVTAPDERFPPLNMAANTPQLGTGLGVIYFRGGQELLAVWEAADCRLLNVEGKLLHHLCDTGAGASGSPIFENQSGKVVGVHTRRSENGGIATRLTD